MRTSRHCKPHHMSNRGGKVPQRLYNCFDYTIAAATPTRHRGAAVGPSDDQLIAEPVHCEDVLRLFGLSFDLAAQLDDEVVDGAVGRACLEPPDLRQNLVARNGLADAL